MLSAPELRAGRLSSLRAPCDRRRSCGSGWILSHPALTSSFGPECARPDHLGGCAQGRKVVARIEGLRGVQRRSATHTSAVRRVGNSRQGAHRDRAEQGVEPWGGVNAWPSRRAGNGQGRAPSPRRARPRRRRRPAADAGPRAPASGTRAARPGAGRRGERVSCRSTRRPASSAAARPPRDTADLRSVRRSVTRGSAPAAAAARPLPARRRIAGSSRA